MSAQFSFSAPRPFCSMIFEDNVKKHILICPRVKKRKRQEEEPYYLENVNCGGHGRLVANPLDSSKSIAQFEPGTSLWAQRIARRVLRAHQTVFKGDRHCDVTAITNADIHGAIEVKDLSEAEISAGIRESFLSHHVKSGGEHHTTQIASLIGHLRQMGFFQRQNENFKLKTDSLDPPESSKDEDPLIIMEMGAGRGMFGLTAAGVASASGLDTHFFMVDRAGSRSKAEKALRNKKKNVGNYLKLDEVNWCRVCCDVSHVNLPVVLDSNDKYKQAKILVIAKHLCGAGTDLALKSLIPIRHKINACLIATCCHGICSWQHYVGRDILRELMEGEMSDDNDTSVPSFGSEEFELLRRWSGATVATRTGKPKPNDGNGAEIDNSLEDDGHTSGINDDTEKASAEIAISPIVHGLGLSCSIQGLGRACQRLIDYGRSEYIHNNIFGSNNESVLVNKLTQYVDPEVTPQNAILWAYRKKKS